MQEGLLPLFPLELVLLPGGQLPLHIFEERYKEMIGESLRNQTDFGVVFANAKGIAETGCTATINSVLREYPDGRLDILTLGRRRFEILLVNQDRPFLQGSVEFFDDDTDAETPSAELRQRAIDAYNNLQQVSASPLLAPQYLPDPQLSFFLAQPIGDVVFRQKLLTTRSEAERMRHLLAFLPEFTSQQRRFQSVKNAAPLNGHGRLH